MTLTVLPQDEETATTAARADSSTARRTAAIAFAVALAALFAFTALFRFLLLKGGFPNDHFLYLASAQQIRFGEWPTRDFLDPGLPLMYVASVAAQVALGPPLFAEAVLVATALAAGAVLTALVVRQLTGSRVLAIFAALLEVAIVPRTYGYPKVLLYAAAFFFLERYVARPTRSRLLALAATVVTAFLFRHDHGVYLGAAAACAAWLAPARTTSDRARHLTVLILMMTLLLVPYAAYVEAFGGVWSYLQTGLAFRSSEFTREWHTWPSLFGDRPLEAALFYADWSLPLAAAFVLVRRRDETGTMAAVAPLIAAAVLVNFTFLRRPLATRLPDAIVPAVTLGAWLLYRTWHLPRRWMWRPFSALLLVAFCACVAAAGQTVDQLERANLLVRWTRIPELVTDVAAALKAPRDERQIPSAAAAALGPFYDYVDRCTTRDQRLLGIGFLPEVFVFAHRPFAGGQPAFVPGYYASDSDQRAVIAHLQRQTVPIALIPGDDYGAGFDAAFPRLARYVTDRYEPLATFGTVKSRQVVVLFDRTLRTRPRDAQTGWPCLK